MRYYKVFYKYYVTKEKFTKEGLEVAIVGENEDYIVVESSSKEKASSQAKNWLWGKYTIMPKITDVVLVTRGY